MESVTTEVPGNLHRSNVSPLAAYGLAGLRRCWMPDRGSWSHRFHLDGRAEPNESLRHSDIYYSLNVLLGLSQVRGALAQEPYDASVLLNDLCGAAAGQTVRNGAWGMALWAAAELGVNAPTIAVDRLRSLGADSAAVAHWQAQDAGLALSGAAAQARHDPSWRPLADKLNNVMRAFRGPGALFRDGARGPRRQFATFATQVYVALALYHYGEMAQDAPAIEAAGACVRKLLSLQGAMGEWPWFYLPGADRVLDTYEVYSVHQHGMGPALLHHAVRHGVPGAREAIKKGFDWVFGTNEMDTSMLVPSLQLIYRSQARRGVQGTREMRLLRAASHALIGGGGSPAGKAALRLTREMRSYEFGWLLWSFGGRMDYPDLTHRAEFADAVEGAFKPCRPRPP